MVESARRCREKTTREVRYDISRLPPRAANLRAAVRGHGSIENAMPWGRDVAFLEVAGGILADPASPNLAILRRIALHVRLQEKTIQLGIANKRLKAAWDPPYRRKLRAILSQGN